MIREIFILAVIGGFLSLDATAVGQTLISQPLLAGPIIGLILGDVQTGLLVGTLLQLIWISKLPVGGANPSLGTALLGIFTAGIVIIYQGRNIQPGLLPVAIFLGTVVGFSAQKGEAVLNRFDDYLIHWVERLINQNRIWGIEVINWLSLIIIFTFSFLLILISTFLGLKLCSMFFSMVNPQMIRGLILAEKMLPILGLAVVFNLFSKKKNVPLFLIAVLIALGYSLLWA